MAIASQLKLADTSRSTSNFKFSQPTGIIVLTSDTLKYPNVLKSMLVARRALSVTGGVEKGSRHTSEVTRATAVARIL